MKQAGLIAGIVASLALVATPVAAKQGDLLLAGNENGGSDDIVRMTPKSGTLTGVAELDEVGGSNGEGDVATFAADGRLYVSDETNGVIHRVNIRTGAASIFSQDPAYASPWGLDLAPDRRLLIADYSSPDIFALRPPSGVADSISSDGALDRLNGIAAAPNGDVFVPLVGEGPDNLAQLLTVDPRSGDQDIVATFPGLTSGQFGNPTGITVGPDGRVYLARDHAVQTYSPRSGATRTISSSGAFGGLYDLELGLDRMLYVMDLDAGVVHRVDPKSGAVRASHETGLGVGIGVAVEPPRCRGKVATIVGTRKNDRITASRFKDVIHTLSGDDKVNAKGGNDVVCGGRGKDKLKGGRGRDKLFGQGGRDQLDGGPGKDKERQ